MRKEKSFQWDGYALCFTGEEFETGVAQEGPHLSGGEGRGSGQNNSILTDCYTTVNR